MTFHLHSVGTLILTVQLYSLASTLHFCLKWEIFLFFFISDVRVTTRPLATYSLTLFSVAGPRITVLCPREWRRRAILCYVLFFHPESFGQNQLWCPATNIPQVNEDT